MPRSVADPPASNPFDRESAATTTAPPPPRATGWATPIGALALVGLALLMALFMWHISDILSAGQPPRNPATINKLREGGDSYGHWFALQALRTGGDPYALEVTRATQVAIWGAEAPPAVQAFAYPLPSLIWYLPLLWLPFEATASYARALSIGGLVVSIGACIRLVRLPILSWSSLGATALLVGFGGVYDQYSLGQNASLAMATALSVALLYRNNQHLLAGLMLPLASVKPHYALLLAAGLGLHALVVRTRWPFLVGVAVSGMMLLITSFVLTPSWVGGWLSNVAVYTYQHSLLEVLIGEASPLLLLVRLLFMTPLFVWWRRRHSLTTDAWYPLAVTGALVCGMLAFTANPSLYNILLAWPALALMLFTPVEEQAGLLARLVRAITGTMVVLTPLGGGLIALSWLLLPATRTPLLAQLATLVVWFGLLQGLLVGVWLLGQVLPELAPPRAAVMPAEGWRCGPASMTKTVAEGAA